MSTKSKARHERRHPEESTEVPAEEIAGTIVTALLDAITFGALEEEAAE